MCEAGCQSLVAILMANGRERSLLIVGITSRPLGTAREPVCELSEIDQAEKSMGGEI